MNEAGGITLSKGVPPACYIDVHLKRAFPLYIKGMGSAGSWERKCRTGSAVSQAPGDAAMWLLQSLWLWFPLSIALSGQHEPKAPGYPGGLRCGLRSFQFTINLSQETATPPALIAWGRFEG